MTFSTWSQTAASNTSVGGISTDGTVTLVKQIDNMFRGMMAELAVARDDGTITATEARGYLHGLALSNNGSDLTNDIDIAVGECVTDASPYWKMALASALTKRLDATWVVGTNQGMRASGAAIADTTYHIFLIRRPDTGVVDIAADTSATGANIAANTDVAYTQKRRIGSILRETAALVVFDQAGDIFVRRVNATTRNSTAAAAAALLTFQVPLGIQVQPLVSCILTGAATVSCSMLLGSASAGGVTQQVANISTGAGGQAGTTNQPPPIYTTNTSGQIYFQQINTSGTPSTSTIVTAGWVDTRGRVA